MEYRLCGWQISCNDLGSVNNCSDTNCTSGCFCSDGVLLQDGVCIDPGICPSKQYVIYIKYNQMISINAYQCDCTMCTNLIVMVII